MSYSEEDRAAALRLARKNLGHAAEGVRGTVAMLKEAGWPGTAEDLARIEAQFDVWLKPDGYLFHLGKDLSQPEVAPAS